jgi:hypothetical protein
MGPWHVLHYCSLDVYPKLVMLRYAICDVLFLCHITLYQSYTKIYWVCDLCVWDPHV